MNIYSYLKKDHRKVSDLIKKIIATKNNRTRKNLLFTLKKEILLHAASEEVTFYKTLKKYKSIQKEIGHANKEHQEITNALDKLDDFSINDDNWLVQLGELKYLIEHHVEEEEQKIFKSARKVLSTNQANNLAKQMEAEKENFLATTT